MIIDPSHPGTWIAIAGTLIMLLVLGRWSGVV